MIKTVGILQVEYGADLRPCNYGYPAMLELVYDLPRDLVDLLEGRFGPMLKPKSTEPTVKPITPGLAVKHSVSVNNKFTYMCLVYIL